MPGRAILNKFAKTSKTGKSGEISSWTTYPSAGVTLTRNQDIYVRIDVIEVYMKSNKYFI